MGLSPGIHSVKFYKKGLKRRLERRSKAAIPSTKRRRLILKEERATNQGAKETLEGISYQSGDEYLHYADYCKYGSSS